MDKKEKLDKLIKECEITEWKNSSDYKECYVPGFWLKVPGDWAYH